MVLTKGTTLNYRRLNEKLESELLEVQREFLEVDKVRTIDINVIEEVLRLTQNLVKTYKDADIDRKRSYLHFFFQKIWVKDRKIVSIDYQPVIKVLNEAKLGILVSVWLRAPRIKRTIDLSHIYPELSRRIIKVFQNPIVAEQTKQRLKQIKELTLNSSR